jgi:Fic family protein
MHSNLFTDNKLGELLEIRSPPLNLAFVPQPLPTDWSMPSELWPLLMQAREGLARLDGVGRHMVNHRLLLVPLQQREALRSSSMEGTYATPEELLLYQMDPRDPSSDTDRANAWREVFNYGKALQIGINLLDGGLPISLRLIREIHQALLSGVRGHNRRPGEFRDCQVQIGAGARFVPPPPHCLDACLDAFEKFHHTESGIDPLIRAFMAHYQFETIHPFRDGNGRVGRLLLSLTIYQWLDLGSPWLYLSSFFERHKDEYIDRLFMVSADGRWLDWVRFCLQGVVAQCHDTIVRIDRLVALRADYLERISHSGGSARLHRILESLFASPVITVPQARDLTEVTYPTAKSDLDRLVTLGILAEGPTDMTPRFLAAPEIIAVAYGDG